MANKTTVIIAVAVVAVLAVAGVGVYMFMNNKGNNDETYNYYLYFGADNEKNGWYSAKAGNATDAFDKAMKDANLEWEKSKRGYIASINGEKGWSDGGWKIITWQYAIADKNSAAGANLGWGNGWKEFSGYNIEGNDTMKFFQSNATIWYLTPYLDNYTFASPDTVTSWKDSGPFKEDMSKKTQDYWFYLYFAADNEKNGWYSAKGENATEAFDKAMKDANLAWEKSTWDYIGSINGNSGYNDSGWYIGMYVYSQKDKTAQDNSAVLSSDSPKGWIMFNGYDIEGDHTMKMFEGNGTIWYLTPYTSTGWDGVDTVDKWKASGPFDA